jgi:hypothetical protein
MKEPGPDHRHRDKNGEIARKHGNTHVGTLRKHYGAGFALGFEDTDTLAHVLVTLDEPSLTKLVKDHRGRKIGWAHRQNIPDIVRSSELQSSNRWWSFSASAGSLSAHSSRLVQASITPSPP